MAYTVMMDDAVGAVIEKLKEIGQYENTVFIFITDHNNTNHGKGSLYDNGVNIPFIVSWPGKITPGESDELVQTIDIAATFFDCGGAEKPSDYRMNGKSLRPFIEGNMDAIIHNSLYLEFGWARGVVTKDAKYIALRYPADIQKDIDNGGTPPIYTKGLDNIGKQASTHNPFYFHNDQLFDYTKEGESNNLLYNSKGSPIADSKLSYAVKEKREEMQHLLTQHLQTFTGHPYYEFFDGEKVSIKQSNPGRVVDIVSGVVKENLHITSKGSHDVEIYSAAGRMLYSKSGANSATYSLSHLSGGHYIALIKAGGSTKELPFVLSR